MGPQTIPGPDLGTEAQHALRIQRHAKAKRCLTADAITQRENTLGTVALGERDKAIDRGLKIRAQSDHAASVPLLFQVAAIYDAHSGLSQYFVQERKSDREAVICTAEHEQ